MGKKWSAIIYKEQNWLHKWLYLRVNKMFGRGIPDELQLRLDNDGFMMNSEGPGNKYLERKWKNIAEFIGKVTFKSKRISCSCDIPYNRCMQ